MTSLEFEKSVGGGLAAVHTAVSRHLPDGEGAAHHAWLALALAALDDRRPRWFEDALDHVDDALDFGRDVARRLPVREWLGSGALVTEFERHLADTDDGHIEGRRNAGAYFTPPDLIALLVERTLAPLLQAASSAEDVLSIRVLDPAVGAGGFMLEVARQLSERLRSLTNWSEQEARLAVVRSCLYGVDANPLAALLTSASLGAFAGDLDAALHAVEWADFVLPPSLIDVTDRSVAQALDTSRWFGNDRVGFDVIVGNPPWGAVKPAVREFFACAEPSLLSAQGAELRSLVVEQAAHVERWASHAHRMRGYAKALRSHGWYRHQGRGDADMYRYFAERAHRLASGEGARIGLLVPAAILRADGATPLRRLLLESGTVEEAVEFINTHRIFDIHSMFRFVMMIWQRGEASGIRRASFGVKTVDEVTSGVKTIGMSIQFLKRVGGGSLTVPEVRDERDVRLLAQLYDSHPLLGDAQRRKRVRFVRELDMTNDSGLFIHADAVRSDEEVVPLYEGRMVHQFDNRAKRYVDGAARRAVWTPQAIGLRQLLPHYFVPSEVAARKSTGHDRAGFCDVTGHANERTILAALVPAHAAAGNKVPTVRFDPIDEPRDHLLWLAYANSLVIDWVARRRVATSLNFFHLQQLPFPEPDFSDPVAGRVVEIASVLSESVECWSLEVLLDRAVRRSELDALVARSFGLSLEDLAYVVSDFALLDRYQPEVAWGRSTITRDVVLLEFARLCGEPAVDVREIGIPTDHGPSDLAERVAAALYAGQIAFIPGELAKSIWHTGTAIP